MRPTSTPRPSLLKSSMGAMLSWAMIAAIVGIVIAWVISALFNINLVIGIIAGLIVFVAIVLRMASREGRKMVEAALADSEPPECK